MDDFRSMHLRIYDPDRDAIGMYELWQETVGSLWPLSEKTFHSITIANDQCLPGGCNVLEDKGKIIAFIVTHIDTLSVHESSPLGSVTLLMVAPKHQRQGHGRRLLTSALKRLKDKNVARVQLGAGAGGYFWPGVPANLSQAVCFFEACGWQYVETSFDMVRDFTDDGIASALLTACRPDGVKLSPASLNEISELLKFEEQHFPNWYQYFELAVKHQALHDILLARGRAGSLIGAVLVSDQESKWEAGGKWQQLLGKNVGAIGCLGVADHARGRGIGLFMADYATEMLKRRGCTTSYIGWTWLVDWYAKLGYKIWREYKMSWQNLS